MKILITTILFIFTSLTCIASSVLYQGQERSDCFAGYSHASDAVNCIHDKWNSSNNQLESLIKNTALEINNNQNYIDPFENDSNNTKGDIYQKRFIESQKVWEKYKEAYCLALLTPLDTDGFDYHPTLEQCEINMNKRRIEEINMMGETQPSLSAP
ncbi:lysozyme inhibitor LprI family protein [Pantoea sp. B65]|uniref:lysozyme inhibitor LprI family protein n=1 Tax=Pantoea sp. B65 TaxID=2813359 RepID=UPI0039B41FFA